MSIEKDLRFYEEVLVLHPDTNESEQKQVFRSVEELLKESKGKIYQVETWGSRPIANPGDKKVSRALYFHTLFSAQPKDIQEIRRRLKINSRVIYFHHEKLHKNDTPETHLEKFRASLEETMLKEKERQARIQKKQQAGAMR